jgi:hypothetical protein
LGTALAVAISSLLVVACGGASSVTQCTTTQGETAQRAQEAQLARCEEHLKTIERCVKKVRLPAGEVVTTCAGGIVTNGACLFARRTAGAFRAAEAHQGNPPATLTVGTNILDCASQTDRLWRCPTVHHPVWVVVPTI